MKKRIISFSMMIVLMLSLFSLNIYASPTESSADDTGTAGYYITNSETSDFDVPARPDIKIVNGDLPYRQPRYVCYVTGVAANSSLNVRSSASASAAVVGSVAYNGSVVTDITQSQASINSGYYLGTFTDKSTGKNMRGYVCMDYLDCQP